VAEVARRYPQTEFILGGGGFADMWFEVPGAMHDLPNLWLETSHILGNGIRTVLETSGPQRVLFASGEPSNRYSAAVKCLQHLELEPDVLRAILCENARRLFAIDVRD
jgi:predicted TIM-barrel fold metal-dependent hydrolase